MSGNALVQSLVRGLDILELAAPAGQGVTVSDMAKHLGTTRPTAFNLARTLVAKGYLDRSGRPARYRLGSALAGLQTSRESHEWKRQAESELRNLFDSLQVANVFLAEPIGGEITANLRIDPARPAVLERNANIRMSPYSSVLGLCFQAFWPELEREQYVQRYAFEEHGLHTWTSMAKFSAFLDRARKAGYAELEGAPCFRVAVPVYGSSGQMVAALGASLASVKPPAPEDLRRACIDAVTAAARRITARLQPPAAAETM